jgi:Transposase and inactivated derivatives
LAGIGNIEDFESADKLAAYVGIVPKVSQSNDTDNRGRITKRGNKLMRTTLVQCTLIATRYSGIPERLLSAHQGTPEVHEKAIIATHASCCRSSMIRFKTVGSSRFFRI